MIYTSTAFLNYMTENAKFKLGTAFLPGKVKQAVPTGGTFFVIARDAPPAQKEAGWAFIKWMTEPAQTISLSKATGYMPIRTSAVNSPEMQAFYKQNPNYKTAIDQLKTAQRFPYTPALIEIQREVIQPNLEAAVLGIKTSAEIMQAAEAKANEILAKQQEARRARRRGWGTPGRAFAAALRPRLPLPGRLLGLGEPLRVGPGDARALGGRRELPRARLAGVLGGRHQHRPVLGRGGGAVPGAGAGPGGAPERPHASGRAPAGRRSSAPTSSRGSRCRCSGSGCSIPQYGLVAYLLSAGRPAGRELARRPSPRALDARAGHGVEDGGLPDGDLPRGAPGHSRRPLRGGGARRRRRLAALPPHHLAAAHAHHAVPRGHADDHELPGLRHRARS